MIFFSSSSVRPPEAVTVIDCCWPVSLSFAETETMPSELMSKVTSISTSPRVASRSPVRMNSPKSSFWCASSLSPCSTMIFTVVWLSFEVLNTSVAEVGTVVFLGISVRTYPPAIATPRLCGVTSSSSTCDSSWVSACACTAAPSATTSSGCTPLHGSRRK